MSNDKVVSSAVPAPVSDPLTDLLRSGARRPIEAAVTAEFEEYLGGVRRPAVGGRSAPRGTQRPSSRTAGSDRDRGGRCAGAEGALPVWSGGAVPLFPGAAYVLRSASVAAAVPWLYLHGVSTGKMRQAVAALVGAEAARGLSANVVSRLKRVWDEEYREWCRRRSAMSGSTCGRTASSAVCAATTNGCKACATRASSCKPACLLSLPVSKSRCHSMSPHGASWRSKFARTQINQNVTGRSGIFWGLVAADHGSSPPAAGSREPQARDGTSPVRALREFKTGRDKPVPYSDVVPVTPRRTRSSYSSGPMPSSSRSTSALCWPKHGEWVTGGVEASRKTQGADGR